MRNTKYSFLYNKIPGIKEIIVDKSLNNFEYKCLDLIYDYYLNPNKKNTKEDLRKALRYQRKQILPEELKERSLNINEKVVELDDYKDSKIIFCYISFGFEVNTFKLLEECLKTNKILCVPVIQKNGMIAGEINNLDNLVKNRYNIFEPREIVEIPKDDIDLIIVPGLAFNPLGYRIGYGGGYYDCFLNGFTGTSLGIILEEFLIAEIIPQQFDQPVNKILTG